MKRIIIISMSIMLVTLAFGQTVYQGGEIRLSPRLLNYQGYLTDTLGNPITNPAVSMTFAIFDAASSGNQKWTETQSVISVSKGIFHVLLGSFSPIPDSVFNNTDRWLQLSVAGQALSPRTRIVSVPYAYTSTYSDTAQFSRNLAADNDWVITGPDMYSAVSGNVGIGISAPSNKLDVNGVICGGTNDTVKALYGGVLAGYINQAGYDSNDTAAVVLGGWNNTAFSKFSTVSGGYRNEATGDYGTVAGGQWNLAQGSGATVGGGRENNASGSQSTIAGGYRNSQLGASGYAFIGGGYFNTADHDYATVSGGNHNTAGETYATVGGGYYNNDSGSYATVGGGYYNTAGETRATVAGGGNNTANSSYATVGGGNSNFAGGDYATVGGGIWDTTMALYGGVFSGRNNKAGDFPNDTAAVVCGGFDNAALGKFSTVSGGLGNIDSSFYTTIGGGRGNLATSSYAAVGGGFNNKADGDYSAVSGGRNNTVISPYGGILSGYYNIAGDSTLDTAAVVAGGWDNTALGRFSVINGGRYNTASANYTMIGGGYSNTADTTYAQVVGGSDNTSSGAYAIVGGGYRNTVDGNYAMIGNGWHNYNAGDYSIIVGGYADTISATGDYSYFFGIGGNLTQDSTFMVDMPHIRFGTEANGYEFPVGDGAPGYVMVTNGSGQMSWGSAPSAADNWYFRITDGADTTLQMAGRWGLARAGNTLYGNADSTHVNFGVACTTGTSGPNLKHCTVSGGYLNKASGQRSTVGGGYSNTASGTHGTVGGGIYNNASNYSATVAGGYDNHASNYYATVGGGRENTASNYYATVAGGYLDTAAAYHSFATNYSAKVDAGDTNSAAFTTSHTTAKNQVRAAAFSTGTLDFAMDHPKDPMNKILNQYAIGSDEVMLMYSGSVVLDANGRATVNLPEYFDDINRDPRIQLTGVGTYEIYVAEKINGNRFSVGGKPGTEVYWTVMAERKDIHAEIARIETPVVQEKKGDLRGHSIDDDAMIGMYDGLHAKNPELFTFKTEEGCGVHEQSKQLIRESEK